MVRLCVPAGEDQHPITLRPPVFGGLSAAEPSLVESPYRACVIAAASTAFRSVLGLARPGTFLRATAFWSIIDGSVTALDIYGRQELNRAVFKLDGVQDPKPWKLWERTSEWTLEDATLFGGVTGLLIGSNPRLLPGATGWSRFLGMTAVGCAVGAKTGEWIFNKGVPYQAKYTQSVFALHRRRMYHQVLGNDKGKASLSRFGQSLLMAYTGVHPFLHILSAPFGGSAEMSTSESGKTVRSTHSAPPIQAGQAHWGQDTYTKHPIQFVAEFDREELTAPDFEHGYRAYNIDPTDTDVEALQEYLDHLDKLRTSDAKELAYLWQQLAQKERDMYRLPQEDPEKDLLRRELQLIHSLCIHGNARVALLGFQQIDTRRRINQIRNQDEPSSISVALAQIAEAQPEKNWMENFGPHKSAEHVRQRWEDSRAKLAQIEHVLAHFDAMKAQGSTNSHADDQAKQLREDVERRKKNIVATERLLKELEDQIHRADSSTGN